MKPNFAAFPAAATTTTTRTTREDKWCLPLGGVGGLPEGEEALEGVRGVGGDDGRAAREVAREVGQRAQQRVLGQLLPEGVQVAHGVGREHGQAGRVRVRRRQLGQHRRLVELRHVDQRARLND